MSATGRFNGYLSALGDRFGDRLKNWGANLTEKGLRSMLDNLEPAAIETATPYVEEVLAMPGVPEGLKSALRRSLKRGNILDTIIAEATILIGALFTIMGGSAPLSRNLEYLQDRVKQTARFDPAAVVTAWRRDPAKYSSLFEDLRDLGWNDSRIEALKSITEVIPGVQDLIRMSVREAFSPEIAERFGQYQDPPTAVYPWAEKIGLSKEWVDRYWAAHWELPSAGEGFEMLHRAIITEDELKLLLRARDVMPFWRDKQIKLSWNVPTRVDVRRFWDLRTIDEKRLREVYTAMGYHGQDLEDYVLWTKIYTEFPDLLARFKNGWVSLDDVRSRLVELGMGAAAAEELLQTKIQSDAAARTNTDRDLTLTDIYKGVRQERISRAEAVGLIMDLGYSTDEAGFKLDVNVPSTDTISAVEERELTKSDIAAGYKNGIITREGARQMLLGLKYTAVDVEFLLKLYDAQIKPPTEEKTRALAKSDIVLGVKRGLITQQTALGMLIDIGYSDADSAFILTINAEESPFSPVNYDEFRDRTQKWRLAAGLGGKPMTEELKTLGSRLVQLQGEVAGLENQIKNERGKLSPDRVLPAEATARVTELEGILHKLQSELIRVRTDYNAKISEWKYAGK
ncbi:MAG: hypothetical protein A2Y89_06700 [Chloroflexi bacterium RBG_13_51_18]|nr:MAG: hypothetical protein A2Y89_06700 [Chloroflexi bacterium RBG_13_51_18]